MQPLKDNLRLAEIVYKLSKQAKTPEQIVTILNARQKRVNKTICPKDKRLKVSPTVLLHMAGIGPETINAIMKHKQGDRYLIALLGQEMTYECFVGYWKEIFDWMAKTRCHKIGFKKLISKEQREGLVSAFNKIALENGGKMIDSLGDPLIKAITGRAFITIEELEEVIECGR